MERLRGNEAQLAALDDAVGRFKAALAPDAGGEATAEYNDLVILLNQLRGSPRWRCTICGAEHDAQYPHAPESGKWGRGAAGGRAGARR